MKKHPEIKKLMEKLDKQFNQEQYVFELCIDDEQTEKKEYPPNTHIVRFHVRSKKNATT